MNLRNERNWLTFIWLGFLAVNCGLIVYIYLIGWIENDSLIVALKEINILYAPYVGVIVAYFWGRPRGSLKISRSDRSFIAIAITGSSIWNLMIFATIIGVLFEVNSIESAMKLVEDLSNIFNWLVAGAIGYYFSPSSDPRTS